MVIDLLQVAVVLWSLHVMVCVAVFLFGLRCDWFGCC